MFVILEEDPVKLGVLLLRRFFRDLLAQRILGFILVDVNSSHPDKYYSSGRFEKKLGDPSKAETPQVYKTYTAAKKRATKLNETKPRPGRQDEMTPKDFRYIKFELVGQAQVAFWIHPEYEYTPICSHLASNGIRFPGCPTQ